MMPPKKRALLDVSSLDRLARMTPHRAAAWRHYVSRRWMLCITDATRHHVRAKFEEGRYLDWMLKELGTFLATFSIVPETPSTLEHAGRLAHCDLVLIKTARGEVDGWRYVIVSAQPEVWEDIPDLEIIPFNTLTPPDGNQGNDEPPPPDSPPDRGGPPSPSSPPILTLIDGGLAQRAVAA